MVAFTVQTRRRFLHETPELPGAADVFAVELHNHIRLFEAGSFGRTVGLDFLNHHSVCRAVCDADADFRAAAGQHHQGAVRSVAGLSVCGRRQHERQGHEAGHRHQRFLQF